MTMVWKGSRVTGRSTKQECTEAAAWRGKAPCQVESRQSPGTQASRARDLQPVQRHKTHPADERRQVLPTPLSAHHHHHQRQQSDGHHPTHNSPHNGCCVAAAATAVGGWRGHHRAVWPIQHCGHVAFNVAPGITELQQDGPASQDCSVLSLAFHQVGTIQSQEGEARPEECRCMWGLAITLDQKKKSNYLEIGSCRNWATQFLITRMYKQLLQTTKIGPGRGNRATQFVAINPQLAQLGHATAAPSGWQRARQAQIAQIPAVWRSGTRSSSRV